jgi:hypothetical protein
MLQYWWPPTGRCSPSFRRRQCSLPLSTKLMWCVGRDTGSTGSKNQHLISTMTQWKIPSSGNILFVVLMVFSMRHSFENCLWLMCCPSSTTQRGSYHPETESFPRSSSEKCLNLRKSVQMRCTRNSKETPHHLNVTHDHLNVTHDHSNDRLLNGLAHWRARSDTCVCTKTCTLGKRRFPTQIQVQMQLLGTDASPICRVYCAVARAVACRPHVAEIGEMTKMPLFSADKNPSQSTLTLSMKNCFSTRSTAILWVT